MCFWFQICQDLHKEVKEIVHEHQNKRIVKRRLFDLILPRPAVAALAQVYCIFAINPHCVAEFLDNENAISVEEHELFSEDEFWSFSAAPLTYTNNIHVLTRKTYI